jgi:hypothetical protein
MPAARPIYVSPNPETTKRGPFTEFFLERNCPEDADPKYRHLFVTHQNLMRMMINDSAMDANREQTFSTPANSKNKVYFMYDMARCLRSVLNADRVEQVGLCHPYLPNAHSNRQP